MLDFESISNCRLCKSDKLHTIYEFGETALANAYPSSPDEKENLYPLTFVKCDDCNSFQLKETIAPETLFKNYSYDSADSPALVKYFKEYANDVISICNPGEYCQILEIASNSGLLLKYFEDLGIQYLVGVDPAENLCKIAQEKVKSARIINDFFNFEVASKIKDEHGSFDLICANNVLAHVKELDSIVKGIESLLSSDGVFVMENAHALEMFKDNLWSLIYHEHLNYFSIKPLQQYLKTFGLEIFDIKKVETQGGSFRAFIKKISNNRPVSKTVKKIIDEEESFGLYNDEILEKFKKNINDIKEDFERLFIELEGKLVVCYGSNAKFSLMSKVLGFNKDNIKYVVDDSPLKQDKFTPGMKIPIVNNEYFKQSRPEYTIITSWNMVDSIVKRNPQYPGKWVTIFPKIEIH